MFVKVGELRNNNQFKDLNIDISVDKIDITEEEFINQISETSADIHDVNFNSFLIDKIDFNQAEISSAYIKNCRFINCDCSKTAFVNVIFENCDMSNSIFENAYFSRVKFKNCKANGVKLFDASIKDIKCEDSVFRYAIFNNCEIKYTHVVNSVFTESYITDSIQKNIYLDKCDFTGVNFVNTKLSDIDFTTCDISAIKVSESLKELKGSKINIFQAADLIKLVGIDVKSEF